MHMLWEIIQNYQPGEIIVYQGKMAYRQRTYLLRTQLQFVELSILISRKLPEWKPLSCLLNQLLA